MRTDYERYLRIPSLLELQEPLTPGSEDELLFIVVHQVYELWFKLLLHELEGARDALTENRLAAASERLRRIVAIDHHLVAQLGIIETMSPAGFLEFRDPLAPASGFQSYQFREIEALSAGLAAGAAAEPALSRQGRAHLGRRVQEPTLWDGFCGALERAGLSMPRGLGDVDRSRRVESIGDLYRAHPDDTRGLLHSLAEAFVDHDEAISLWRHRHVLMAEREIGDRAGTGGSSGVEYLKTTVPRRFFPDLWSARSVL